MKNSKEPSSTGKKNNTTSQKVSNSTDNNNDNSANKNRKGGANLADTFTPTTAVKARRASRLPNDGTIVSYEAER